MAKLTHTVRDLAKAMGLGKSTVAYALRGDPKIPAATRERIKAEAHRLGWRENPLLSTWMAHVRRSRRRADATTMAFLTFWRDNEARLNAFACDEFSRGARERAESLGFRLETIEGDAPRMTDARLNGILLARGIQGVLVGPTPRARPALALDWSSFAAATWGYSVREPNLHRVSNHQIHSVILAVEQLRRRGFKRIGLALQNTFDTRHDNAWRAGFQIERHRLNNRFTVVPFIAPHQQWNVSHFRAWLRRTRPDAVVSNRLEVWSWLEACRLRPGLPDGVGFADLDWTPVGPPRNGVNQRHAEVGAAVVDLIVGQIYANERGLPATPKVVLIESTWVDGAAT